MRSLEEVIKDLEAAEKEYKEKCDKYGIEETKKRKQNNKHLVLKGNILKSDIDLSYLKIVLNDDIILEKEDIKANEEINIEKLAQGKVEYEIKSVNGDIYRDVLMLK